MILQNKGIAHTLFHFLLLALLLPLSIPTAAHVMCHQDMATDTTSLSLPSTSAVTDKDSIITPTRDWWRLLKNGELDLADTTVVYPRFLGFCIKAYNWGDRFFNGIDTTYVRGTGRRWKAYVKSDNWVDSYAMNFNHHMQMRMTSDIYCAAGAYLQYMAVSVGYSLDLSNIIGNKPSNHKKLEFSFACQRFSADLYYHDNTGGSFIRTFGKYKDGKLFKKAFPGLSLHNYGFDFTYFFNNRRYSQGAAYNFAKYQIRTAGSFILGYNYSNLNIDLDLNQLPESLIPYLTIPASKYKFHYNTYNILLGYGINIVPRTNWVLNFTVTPAIGINHCYEDSADGAAWLMSLGVKGKTAAVYNTGDFFLGVNARFDGHWYRSNKQSFFSSIENLAGVIGVRF